MRGTVAVKEANEDMDLHTYCWSLVKALPQDKIDKAVTVLRTLPGPAFEDLKARIIENRTNWIGGRENMPCWVCASGLIQLPKLCTNCKGTGKGKEMSLHFGFGMAIRNYLRQNGADELIMGIANWDDYYVPIVELATGFTAP